MTIVTGRSSLAEGGYLEGIKRDLEGLSLRIISGISPMPSLTQIGDLVRNEAANVLPEVIVGIGGGSVLDAAKCLSTLLLQDSSVRQILLGGAPMKPQTIPFIAVPTTAGTGSEVTSWSTVWDFEDHKKYSLTGKWMYPKYALLDPEFTATLPPRITAVTGLDALTHAIEAAYSIHSTEDSDEHAFEALSLIPAELVRAVLDSSDKGAREKLLRSSLNAGLAIAQTMTAAAHSASYPLSIHYGIPHGQAVGLLVPEFLVYNTGVRESDCLDPRGVSFVEKRCRLIAHTLGCQSYNEARDGLRRLIAEIGLETTLHGLGVRDLGLMAREGVHPGRAFNNPRKVTEESVRSILERIYD